MLQDLVFREKAIVNHSHCILEEGRSTGGGNAMFIRGGRRVGCRGVLDLECMLL